MALLNGRPSSILGGRAPGAAALAIALLLSAPLLAQEVSPAPALAQETAPLPAEDASGPALATSSPVSVDAAGLVSSGPAPQAAGTPQPQLPAAPTLQKPSGNPGFWGFTTLLGTGGAGGDFGNLFRNPVTWDYQFFRQQGPWRVGLGVSFDSFRMKDPYQEEPEWGYQQASIFGTRLFNKESAVRPYLQVHVGTARIRPRSELFVMNPLPADWTSGQQRMAASDGYNVGVVPGLELRLGRAAYLDASLDLTYFHVSETDLSPVGQPARSSGTSWVARFGVTWLPNGEQWGDAPSEGGPRDAWGVKRSYGWAAGEVLAINNISGVAAQYVRNVDWSETNPRSWWDNIETGFKYDPDPFKTNQWTHPFNGAAYYNSARSNGISFWPSAAFSFAGAFEWECCGETQRMSYNDMINTPIGGIALGEAQYRLSSEILDNRSRGLGRFFREFGAFLVDPVRGFNRLVTGDATKVADNPVDPMDWRPKGGQTFLAAGVRSIGQSYSVTDAAGKVTKTEGDTKSYATLLLNHSYGDVFANTRRKPFDYMDFVAELNFGEKVALGNVQIRGDFASWPIGGGEGSSANHVFALIHHFDYMNNTSYEFGGQAVGAALTSRFRLSDRMLLTTRLDADGILIGGINSEYSYLADVANPERLREYDYGPGLGTTARADLTLSGRPLLSALYRFAWINVKNGSVYNTGTTGSDADHYIQGGGLRLVIPVHGNLGLGADAYVFLRDSDFALIETTTGARKSQHITQRNPQVRVYLAFSNTR